MDVRNYCVECNQPKPKLSTAVKLAKEKLKSLAAVTIDKQLTNKELK